MQNTIKKTLALVAVGLAASALMCQQAQAVPITAGSQISFSGVVNFNHVNNIATATDVDHWFHPDGTADGHAIVTAGASGSFAGIAGGTDATFFNGYIFSPSTSTPGLWSVGGFTFNLLTSVIVTQNATDLIIKGTGTIVSGTDTTAGNWDFHVSNAGGQSQSVFSFAASTSAVPDGGSAVALLGLALTGVEALRRKFARK
jgi:hypothetical protein